MRNEAMKVTMITVDEMETVVGGGIPRGGKLCAEGIYGIPRGGRVSIRVKGFPPMTEEDPTKAGIRVRVRV